MTSNLMKTAIEELEVQRKIMENYLEKILIDNDIAISALEMIANSKHLETAVDLAKAALESMKVGE